MTLRFVATDQGPRAIGPYSQAVVSQGLVCVAGQIAFDPATMEVVAGGIKDQTARVLANLQAILQAAGSDLTKVIKTTVFLVDMADFTAMNEVYAQVFGDHKPARSTVAVSALPRGVRVEIDAIAAV